jgi:hypothetical protein
MIVNTGLTKNSGDATDEFVFSANNQNSVDVNRGTGPNTYTCPTARYIPDFEGKLQKVAIDSPSFPGLRAVTNLLTYSEDFSYAAWVPNGTCTVTGTNIVNLTAVNDGTRHTTVAVAAGSIARQTAKMSGTGTVSLHHYDGISSAVEQVTLTSTPKVYSLSRTCASTFSSAWISRLAGDTATQVTIDWCQLEDVTNQTNQNPGEYISTTTKAITKWFDYANGNTVDGNGVVTEARGASVLPNAWYKGLLSEPAGSNLFLNTDALGTQTVTVTAQAYTVSFQGTGTITFTGTYAGAPLVGTGALDRVSRTFTPTAGGSVCTISGSVLNGQYETGTVATSYMPSLGTSGPRGATSDLYPSATNFPTNNCTIMIEAQHNDATATMVYISSLTGVAGFRVYADATNLFVQKNADTATIPFTRGLTNHKIVVRVSSTQGVETFIDGVKKSQTIASTANITHDTNFYVGSSTASTFVSNAYFGQVKIFNTALSDAD